MVGCGAKDALEPTNKVIDEAIVKMTQQSGDWKSVLQETMEKLPKDAQSFVRVELQNTLDRSVAAAGSEVRCVIDFVGERTRQTLIRLKARLLGQAAEPRRPVFCSVVPPMISMADRTADPNRIQVVELYGYDFDAEPPMQVMLSNNNQTVEVNPNTLTRQTHYHLTLNLGANGVPLGRDSQMITVRWNGASVSQIPVVQPHTPKCRTQVVPVDNVGTRLVRAVREQGDLEFWGRGPTVEAGARLSNREAFVEAEVWITAIETSGGDNTIGRGKEVFTVYSAPPGWKVLHLVTPAEDIITYTDTNWEKDDHPRGGNGPVRLFETWGDTHGNDLNEPEGARVLAYFNRIQVEIVETTNCQ